MCRFVTLAVIAASLVSCVLAETPPNITSTSAKPTNLSSTIVTPTETTPKPNAINCLSSKRMKDKRKMLMECFTSTVQYHLDSSAALANKNCTNATVFGQELEAYLVDVVKECNTAIKYNFTNFVKLIEFSLRNNSFKTFYEDVTCLKSVENKISNNCVRDNLGFFNITQSEKHVKWYRKGQLTFNADTCWNSKKVRNCVNLTLQECPKTTNNYVMSLFEYARSLENCSQYADPVLPRSGRNFVKRAPLTGTSRDVTVPVMETYTSNTTQGAADSTTWLTTPVISGISVGVVVVIGAIVAIIIKKK